jgi:chromosome segregation ATPase
MRFAETTSSRGLKRAAALSCAICCLVTIIWGAQSGGASSGAQGSEGHTLRALLEEVHQLRLTLQRTSLNTTRAQLAFERMRLQRSRLDVLLREVESVRAQRDSVREALAQAGDRFKELEEQTGHASDAALRARFERQLGLSKQVLNAHARREEQLRERDAQLNAQLQAEQAKLGELEDQLANLERELSAP